MKNATELSPCPFCGAQMTIAPVGRDWWRLDADVDHHEECMLLGRPFDVAQTDEQRELLAKDWNTRSASPAPGRAPLTDEQLDRVMRVCISIAERYAFVGDAAFPRGREKLRDAIEAAHGIAPAGGIGGE